MYRFFIPGLILLAACPARTGTHEGQGDTTIHERLSVPAANAALVEGADQLLDGPRAEGSPGDVRMENGEAVIIVSDVKSEGRGHAQSGGNVIDMALRADGRDELAQIFTYFDDTFPRQAVYTQLEIVEAGGPGKRAVVEVRGHDSDLATLAVTTRYVLQPTGRTLRIETSLHNEGDRIEGFEVGDAFAWGATRHFVPGPGYDLSRKRQRAPWLAGVGQGVSYGTVAVGTDSFETLHGGGWSDTILATWDLARGQSRTYVRDVVVASSFAGLAADLHGLRGDTLHRLTGTVRDGNHGVARLTLRLDLDAAKDAVPKGGVGYWLDVVTDDVGGFSAQVPAGRWKITPTGGARTGAPVYVTVRGDVTVPVVVSGEGLLAVSVTQGGRPSPHRLRIRGKRGTPTPRFGGSETAWGKNRIASHSGSYKVPLAPGRYEITASRGPEFEVATTTLDVLGGAPTPVSLELVRAFETPGWVAGDFHQHAAPSSDSPTTLRDRVKSNLAEGVEILGSSDHNHITDYAPVIGELGVAELLVHVVGCEVTTRGLGHFNTFPLTADPTAPAGGALSPHGLDPAELFARMRAQRGLGADPKAADHVRPIIQVNHPRSGKTGYFDLLGVEPGRATTQDARMQWGFEALEVLNGRHTEPAERTMEDWFALLDRGALITAMGNSDTHTIHTGEAGLARTWLELPDAPSARAVATAVRGRRAVVSNGPFLTVTLGDAGIGSFVPPAAKGSHLPLTVTVHAASWVDLDTVEIIRNGTVVHTWDVSAAKGPQRLHATWRAPTDRPAWYVVRARGHKRMTPVYPTTPLAFTNPVWVGTVSE